MIVRLPILFFVMMMSLSCVHDVYGSYECSPKRLENNKKELIVSVHGFGRDESTMDSLSEYFHCKGYTSKVVGYDTFSMGLKEIETQLFTRIDQLKTPQFKKVHFVGHSFGGLLVRSYLKEKPLKNLGRVINIGSPSKGTPVVDRYKDKWWFNCLVPAALSMSSKGSKFLEKIKNPDYPLGIIAGTMEMGRSMIKGESDGLVPLESTKVEGMSDFIKVKSHHGMLRYNDLVAEQAVTFIRHGKFLK